MVGRPQAWNVTAAELVAANCNLDRKNPRALDDITHRAPEELVASILDKEAQIALILGRIQGLLEKSVA